MIDVGSLAARLASERAAAEWRKNAPKLFDALLAMKVKDIADPTAIADALDALLSRAAIDGAARPIAKRMLAITVGELELQRRATAGDHVPEAAKKRIDRFLERPGLVPERLVREVVEQDALEEVMRDVLHEALHEFSSKVNPIALFKKIVPFGGFGMGKGLESVKAEFDKRLDPEIRKFLQAFSRRALKKTADYLVAKADSPQFIALRKELLRFVLDQELAKSARGLDRRAAEEAQDIALDVSGSVLDERAVRSRRRELIAEMAAKRGEMTIGEVLTELGVTWRPDLDPIARATWPIAKAMFASSVVRDYFASIAAEPT